MAASVTLNASSARFDTFLDRTPLEEELFRDLAGTTLRDVEAVLRLPLQRRAARFCRRIAEKFVKEMLTRFVRIAEAKRRRAERACRSVSV